MICSSKTKCSVFSQHILFLFLMCFKICKFTAVKEEINRQTENTFHFRGMNQFKKSNFASKPRLRYYKAIPKKIPTSPVAKMNGIVNTSKSQISPMVSYLFKKQLLNAINNYSSVNPYIPFYLHTNKITTQNKNDFHESVINKRTTSNLLPSKLLNLFCRQNSAHQRDAIKEKFKKSLPNQVFHQNFSTINKINIEDIHKINSNVKSTEISPGVFYRKYFSNRTKPNHKSNLNSKVKKNSFRLTKRRILNDIANSSNIINQFTNLNMLPQMTVHHKHSISRRKNFKELFENNHAAHPVITNIEKLSKNLKKSDNNNLKKQNIIHLKKKTITMELNNGRTGANKNSEKLSKLFNIFQIMRHNNEEIKADYRDGMNINKEYEKSSAGVQNLEGFTHRLYSFQTQNEEFTYSTNEKNKKLSYGISPTKITNDKIFNYKPHSFHNQGTFNLKTRDNSGFIVKYSEKSHSSPDCKNDSDTLKNIEFGSSIAERVLNWGIQTNISRNINLTEKSDSIKPKENIVLRKSNKKSNIQLKIENFERNNFVEPDHKLLETYSLAVMKQKGQKQSTKVAVSLILMILISLTLIVLFLSCCSFLITQKEKELRKSTFNYQMRKPLRGYFQFDFCKKCVKSVKNLVDENAESLETANMKMKMHYKRKEMSTNFDKKCYRKDSEIFEISKSNAQESFKESNTNMCEDSKSDIKLDLQDPLSDNLQNLNNAYRKGDSVHEKYAQLNEEDSMHFEKGNIFVSSTTLSTKDCEKHSGISEIANCSSLKSFQMNEMENRIGSPWNWILKNVKVSHSFKETQCKENQNNIVDYQSNLSDDIIRENITKDAYSNEGRTVECLLPECNHYHFETVQKLESGSTLKVKQDEFFTKEIVHEHMRENDKESHEQMQSPSKFNYSLKSKTNNVVWRENFINVKTKSITSLDKNCAVHDLKHINEIKSNSPSKTPSTKMDEIISSRSNLRTNNEVNSNVIDVLPQYDINAKTVVMKDICIISPGINSDFSAAKYIVKSEQTVSDLSEQNQYHTSTNTYYPNSSES